MKEVVVAVRLQIADLQVELVGARPYTEALAADYVTTSGGVPDVVISAEDTYPLQLAPSTSPDIVDACRVAAVFAQKILTHGAAVLHASAVVHEGRAYLFSAPSGVGKSTHTAQWLAKFPGAYLLNDDKPVLRAKDGVVYAYGSPWAGKRHLQKNACVPLGGICFLKRGKVDRIETLSAVDALPLLYLYTMREGLSEQDTDTLLTLVDTILSRVPIFLLSCTPTPHAAEVAASAMLAENRG